MVQEVYRAGRLYGFKGVGGRKVFTVKRHGVSGAIQKAERADRAARSSRRNPLSVWGFTALPKGRRK